MARKTIKGKNTKKTFSNNSYTLQVPSDTKFLIIHESPTEAKTASQFKDKIEKELGGTVVLLATMGHFYYTSSKSLDIDEKKYMPEWKLEPGHKNVVANIKKAYEIVKRNKGTVIIGTDPDREGEVIAYEIVKLLNLKKGTYKRMRMREIGERGYLKALKNLEPDLDWNMVDSGIARQVLDKLVGFKMSPKLWDIAKQYKIYVNKFKSKLEKYVKQVEKKYKGLLEKNKSFKKNIEKYGKIDWKQLDKFENRLGISIGRVQTPTLRLLVEKDMSKFEKEYERKLNLFLVDKSGNKWSYSKNSEYENQPEKIEKVYRILNKVLKDNNIKEVEVIDIKKQEKKVSPPSPLDTVAAQTSIGNTFGHNVSKVMSALKSNYEQGYSTYPRTDSIDVPDDYKRIIKEIIQKNNIKAKFVDRNYKKDSKNIQEGHHAILPTRGYDLNRIPGDGDNQKILEYIIRRSVAAFLEPAEIEYINYIVSIKFEWKGKKKEVKFILQDKNIKKLGYLEVFKYQIKDYRKQYNFQKGDKIKIDKLEIKEKEIKLPGNYNQTSLVKELEKLGIGRPSTYQSIIETILDKQYVVESDDLTIKEYKKGGVKKKGNGKKLNLTAKGYWVYQMIVDNSDKFGAIFDLEFTAKMEDWLDEIASGKRKKNDVIKDVLKYLKLS